MLATLTNRAAAADVLPEASPVRALQATGRLSLLVSSISLLTIPTIKWSDYLAFKLGHYLFFQAYKIVRRGAL